MELRSNNVKAQRYLRAGFDPPNWALAPMAKAYAHRCSLPRIGIGVGVGVDNSFRKSMQKVILVSAPRMRMGGASELQRELGVHCNYEKQRQKDNDIGGNGVGKSTSDENKQLPIGDDDNQHKSPKRSLLLLLRNFMKCSPRAIIKALLSFLQQYSRQVTISTAVGSLVGLCYLGFKLTAVPSPTIVPYSDLVLSVQSGTVTQALFEEDSRRIFYNMTQPKNVDDDVASGLKSNLTQNSATEKKNGLVSRIEEMNGSKWHYSTRRIKYDESHLLSLMREHGVTYCSAPQPITASIRSILLTIICLWIPLTPLIWIIVRQISANSSSAPKRRSSKQVVRFEDVAGVDVAKSELIEIVSCLQGAINFSKLGAKLPKGVLLVGPPGTGKTLLARAVAGEAKVPFFATSASEFVELFVGRGAARIRDLFNVARKCAPSIIFIDELDAVGGRRGRSFNDERDQTLNQLLTEMDGFESGTGVLVIAATNRPEALDSALCRPGRFSRRVFVREPSVDGRREILAIHLRGMPLQEDPEIVCNFVASMTSGFVGADLANVVNEAALLAARQGNNAVTLANLREAVHRAKFGIGDKTVLPTIIGKEIGRWFPWIPSKTQGTINDNNDEQPWGYQTLT